VYVGSYLSLVSFIVLTWHTEDYLDRMCREMRNAHACFMFNMPQTGKSGKDTQVKQTLLEIKRTTNVTTKALAERARLPVADVFAVETGEYSSKEIAQRVITAFNQLSGKQVRLDDISVHHTNLPLAEHSFRADARKGIRKIAPVKVVSMNTRGRSRGGRP
jgi:hypothetical protein